MGSWALGCVQHASLLPSLCGSYDGQRSQREGRSRQCPYTDKERTIFSRLGDVQFTKPLSASSTLRTSNRSSRSLELHAYSNSRKASAKAFGLVKKKRTKEEEDAEEAELGAALEELFAQLEKDLEEDEEGEDSDDGNEVTEDELLAFEEELESALEEAMAVEDEEELEREGISLRGQADGDGEGEPGTTSSTTTTTTDGDGDDDRWYLPGISDLASRAGDSSDEAGPPPDSEEEESRKGTLQGVQEGSVGVPPVVPPIVPLAVPPVGPAADGARGAKGQKKGDGEKRGKGAAEEPEGGEGKGGEAGATAVGAAGGREVHLDRWQVIKLAKALRQGRRQVNVKALAGETHLDRDDVLHWLKNPPDLSSLELELDRPPLPPPAAEVPPPVAEPSPPAGAAGYVASGAGGASAGEGGGEEEEEGTEQRPLAEGGGAAQSGPWTPGMQKDWHGRKKLQREHEATFERVFNRTRFPSGAMVANLVDLTHVPRKRILEWFAARRELAERSSGSKKGRVFEPLRQNKSR